MKLTLQKTVGNRAFWMSVGTFISRILGLIRDIVIGMFFSRTETDAFFVAFRVPNFFRRFLGEGALSISFIPIFIQCFSNPNHSTQDNLTRAKNFMNSVYTILLICISILTVLGIIFMDPILNALFIHTPFFNVEGKMFMTTVMAKLLFVYLFFITLYAYFMGIANALGYFFVPALAPACLNIFIILFAFLPKSSVSFPPLLLCYGVITGGIAQVFLTALVLYQKGFLPQLTKQFSYTNLKVMALRFFPGLLGVGGFALIGFLNLYFCAHLEEGTHTFIYYGDRLLELPRSLIAISLGTALLPQLSQLIATGEKQKMLQSAATHRDHLLFLILPCSLSFWLLGLPIVEILFQRGLFDSETAQKTAQVLSIYSVLLVTSSLSRVLLVSFYAVKNTWVPALSCIAYIVFHWFLTPFMIHHFSLSGLVWSSVCSNAFFLILLSLAHPFCVGRGYIIQSIKNLFWVIPSLYILFLYLKWCLNALPLSSHSPSDLLRILTLIFVILSSCVVYIGINWLLKTPQAFGIITLIKQKIWKSN